MRDHPEQHVAEWAIWEKTKDDILSKRTTFYEIDWRAYLPNESP
jgi:hypothetical protein